MQGKGTALADSSPLTCLVGDRHYEASVAMDIEGDAIGGLALFYDQRGYAGVGFSRTHMLTHHYGQEHAWMREPVEARTVLLKLVCRDQVAAFHYSLDGRNWKRHPWQMEVSGFHHNVFGGFLSLRIALFAAGRGELRWRDFVYRGLPA
jgi:xylan 1,4-beta-xylosidase